MLSPRSRRSVISYLDSFYADITDPDRITKEFIEMCIPAATEEFSSN